jgi:metal-dependent amidase/aminoacylase/carboxypeptidase family protein
MTDAKSAVEKHLASVSDEAVRLSHAIHADPELGFAEHHASALVAATLEDAGFAVRTGVADLSTAVSASYGNGELVIGLFAEYDALPGIGHACGHNIIASAAVTAGLLLAPVADDLGITVKVFGTPGEENLGGKAVMLEKGAFDGLHAAMMVHPAPGDAVGLTSMPTPSPSPRSPSVCCASTSRPASRSTGSSPTAARRPTSYPGTRPAASTSAATPAS